MQKTEASQDSKPYEGKPLKPYHWQTTPAPGPYAWLCGKRLTPPYDWLIGINTTRKIVDNS